MSEYIVKLPESGAADEAVKRFGVDGSRLYGYQLTGEVVRCRDCANYSGEGNEVYPRWCMAMNAEGIEPDGFCAWAERRDA